MKVSPAHAPRWTAPTPGMPARFERLRFMSADAGAAGTEGAGTAEGASTATGTTGATTATTAATAADTSATTSTDELAALAPDALAKMVRDLRAENAASRTNAKTQAADEARTALAREVGKALGLVTDEQTTPDPAKLTAEVAAARDTARQAQVELAVYRAAATANADAAALLDSRTFLAKVADLDPTAGDFQTKVTAAITTAVTDNPKLRTTQAVGSSSVDHAGGTGEQSAAMHTRPGQPRLAAAYAGA